MNAGLTREEALALLKKYNKDPFHIQHAFTVEAVMKWYAQELGYGEEAEFWGIVGLLHDLDFEKYPEEHCIKSQEIMKERGIDEKIIHATASHGYAITVDIKPEHEMEKILYAVDELTGLIGAVVLMRPSKSVQDLTLKSVKKKYKPCPLCTNGSEAAGSTVYVFRYGGSYHNAGCDSVDKYVIDMDRADAVIKNYSPCSVCGGK